MSNYYFLATLLPPLSFTSPPDISFEEFEQLLKDNLTAGDMHKARVIRRYFDILNLRSYWKGEALDSFGNFNATAFEEAFITRRDLPNYVFDFVDKYESNNEKILHFPELLHAFFREEVKEASDFFKKYLEMEHGLHLVLLAFRAKQMGRDVMKELQFENPENEVVAQILAQKDAPNYEPPEQFEDLKGVFEKNYNDPIALQQALNEYRFNKVEQMIGLVDTFSINRILGYMVQLILVLRWQALDKEKGLKIFDNILKETP